MPNLIHIDREDKSRTCERFQLVETLSIVVDHVARDGFARFVATSGGFTCVSSRTAAQIMVRVPYAPGVSDAEVALPGEARSVPQARRFVREVLASWHLDGAEPAASLAVSELVANAVLHARSDVTVRVFQVPGGVRVEVHDASPRQPAPRSYPSDATTGRGLALVAALARNWGVEPTTAGKAVWCEIDQAETEFNPSPWAEQAPDLDQFVDPFEAAGTQAGRDDPSRGAGNRWQGYGAAA